MLLFLFWLDLLIANDDDAATSEQMFYFWIINPTAIIIVLGIWAHTRRRKTSLTFYEYDKRAVVYGSGAKRTQISSNNTGTYIYEISNGKSLLKHIQDNRHTPSLGFVAVATFHALFRLLPLSVNDHCILTMPILWLLKCDVTV